MNHYNMKYGSGTDHKHTYVRILHKVLPVSQQLKIRQKCENLWWYATEYTYQNLCYSNELFSKQHQNSKCVELYVCGTGP